MREKKRQFFGIAEWGVGGGVWSVFCSEPDQFSHLRHVVFLWHVVFHLPRMVELNPFLPNKGK